MQVKATKEAILKSVDENPIETLALEATVDMKKAAETSSEPNAKTENPCMSMSPISDSILDSSIIK